MILQFVIITMVFAMSLVVSIAHLVEMYARLVMKGISVKHAKKGFTSAMVSQMVKLIHLLVWVQHVKVPISTLCLTSKQPAAFGCSRLQIFIIIILLDPDVS